ncbi:MAG TPA: L-threonylcarbamoyladenylate synthase [Vicinamibacterales bacterium]|nr:threonylcarbamoyl-AMP synthase [Acidobacteriota bacterium]HOC17014.1 L-threonylcarbamoyladenylate synthase [Vicinamibacterales bacterium]
MRTWTVNPSRPDESVLAEAAAVVRQGGVVVFPTDTLYGLAADPCDARAVDKVFAVKGRAGREPLPLIVAGLEEAETIARMTTLARRLAAVFWPGPLTLVVDDRGIVAPAAHAGTGTIGMRVPASPVAAGLARLAGGVVTSTSANRSGAPAPVSAAQAWDGLGEAVDGLLDGGPAPGGRPSTIVDARGERPVMLRAGAIEWERVVEALERR